MHIRRIVVAAVAALAAWLCLAAAANAQRMSMIRDAEIEHTIREYSRPVFSAAGLSPDAVGIYIINDSSLNAFVAGGQNMFIHTGLLIRAQHAGQVIGVMAHEAGHIAGGHLIRLKAAYREAMIKQVIATILGAGAAVAARDGRAAGAAISLGDKIAKGTFLKYTRMHERSADQFAVRAMDAAGISSRGLLEFMQVIEGQELLISSRQDPYVRTHPITADRIKFLRTHIANSVASNRAMPARYKEMHARMRAKLIGYLNPGRVPEVFPPVNQSVAARYARAIAAHKNADTDQAIALMKGLIKQRPNDPFFHDQIGQIYFETGRIPEAVVHYRKAARLAPDIGLIRTALGQALLAVGSRKSDQEALGHLRIAVRDEKNFPLAWRLLGIAYGRLGQIGFASWALAEYGFLIRDEKQVWGNIRRAEKRLPKGSPTWYRVQDLKREMARMKGR